MSRERYLIRFSMKAEGDDAEVMIYSEISSSKWWGDETTPTDFDKALKEARKNGATKLTVRVNSPGGDVFSAVAMRTMIINAGFESVRVMIEGLCASAATLIAAIPAAHVVIAEGSEFMIHNPWTIAWGNADDLAKEVDHLRQMEATFREIYSNRTGQDAETNREWMDNETWFTAQAAVENGFCDEILEAEPIAACVTPRDMDVMKSLYHAIPKEISVRDEPTTPTVSPEDPVAGFSTEINNHEEEPEHMEIKDISMDQLRAENPALLEQIQQEAVTAERQRQDDIDALTVPGYEAMATEAKANGTSAMDFQRQIVAAMKQKGATFMQQRQQETTPAKGVTGGAAEDGKKSDEDEIEANAREIAAYAKAYAGSDNESMF